MMFRRPSTGAFFVLWSVLFFGILGVLGVVLVKRARARAHQERLAPEYQANVPVPVAPVAHVGTGRPTRPWFDAPGGLPDDVQRNRRRWCGTDSRMPTT